MPDVLPNENLSSIDTSSAKKLYITIAAAAKILGVSIDTIRRWDSQGILHSERLDGKNRYFLKSELKAFKKNRPLSISEAAIALSVSISTLRRLEKKGAVVADRSENGERLYSQHKINEILASRKKERTKPSDLFSPSLLRVPEANTTGALNLSGQDAPLVNSQKQFSEATSGFGSFTSENLNSKAKKSFWRKNYMLGRIGQYAALGSPLSTPKKRVHFGNYAPEYKRGIITFTFLLLVSSGIFAFTVLHDNPAKNQDVLAVRTPQGLEALAKLTPQQRAQVSQAVLAAATAKGQFTVNIKSLFNEDIKVNNKNVDLGTGEITASNVVYSLGKAVGDITLGTGLTMSENVLSAAAAATPPNTFSKITAGATTITAGSSTDTLILSAGTGISISGSGKTITFSNTTTAATNYFTLSGTNLYPTSTTYSLGIGNTSPATTLDVTGTFNVSGTATFGDTTTLNGLTYTWPSTESNTYVLQTNGSGVLSWIDPGTLPSSNYFTISNGAVYPNNPSLDLLVGGASTASAKFGFINVAAGTPAIQISGTTVLTGTTLGSGVTSSSLTTTGALVSGSIASGFGTIATTNTITGTTLNGTTGINTGAGLGTQRIDTSGNLANIGTTQFNSLTYTWPAAQVTNYVLQTNGAGVLSWVSPSGSGFGTNYFTINNGAIYPTNVSLDFLIGGGATASARFAILNVNSGAPTASLSAGAAGGAYLTADGTLQTTATQNLTIGGLTTGNITMSPLNGTGTVTINGAVSATSTITGTTLNGTTGINTGAGAGTTRIDVSGNLTNIGTISSTYLNASASTVNLASGTSLQSNGVTVIDASRNLTNIGTTQLNAITYTWPVTDAAVANYVLVSNSLGVLSWTNPGELPTVNYFSLTNGAIYPKNPTVDLLVGGSASASAKFGFINVNSGTPAIQISGTTVLTGTTLGSGVLASSLTSVGALASGSIASGFGTIATATTITGTTLNGTTGINTGAGAGTQRIDSSGNLTSIGTTQFNTITYTWPATQTASYVLQTDGAGGLSWANPTGAGFGTNYFSLGTGTIYPTNTSLDFLVGGSSSSSARFAVLNVNSGTPIASLSAGAAGGLYLTAAGTLQTTANQGITIGGDTTGNITLKPFNGTGGTVIIQGTTTLNGIAYTWPAADAAVSGYVLSSNGTGTLSWISQSGGSAAIFSEGSGLIYATNTTEDFAIGGTATTSAKFAVLNVNSGTPTASLSAGAAGGAYLNATGTLQTTANQTLTLGGDTTGNITLSPLNGSGKVTSTGTLNLSSGKTYQINATDVLSATTLGTGVLTSSLTTTGALVSGSIASGFGTIATTNTITGTTLNGTTGINTGAAAGTNRIDVNGNLVNIGTISSTYLTTSTNVVNLAASTVLQSNGTTVIDASRNLTNIGTTQLNTVTYTWPGTQSANYVLQTNGSGTLSWVNPTGSGFGTNYWSLGTGTIYPTNVSLDFLIGNSATTSAKFAVLNVDSGTPTASLSAGAAGGAYLNATGTLQTTAGQTLSLGGITTGSINLGTDATARLITIGNTSGTVRFTLGSDATGDIFYRNSSGNFTRLAVGTSAQCLIGGTIPAWSSNCLTSSTGVTTAAGTANQILVNAGTSAVSGAITLTLPSAITAPGSLTTTTTLTATTDFTVNGNTLIGNATSDTVSIFPTTLAFAKENAHTIQITDSTTGNTAGGALTILGAAGAATNAAGGAINITGGQGGATGTGGAISIVTGAGGGTSGTSGILTLSTGTAASGAQSGVVTLNSGNTTAASSGTTTVSTGTTTTSGTTGILTLSTGASAAASGAISLVSGTSTGNNESGAINIVAGQTAGTTPRGIITIGTLTAGTGASVGGQISILTPGGGAATGAGLAGGLFTLTTGAGSAGASGNAAAAGGAISVTSGDGGQGINAAGGAGGLIKIVTGSSPQSSGATTSGAGGALSLITGNGGAAPASIGGPIGGAGGAISIVTGTGGQNSSASGVAGAGGVLLLQSGAGGANAGGGTGAAGGAISITAGTGTVAAAGGAIILTAGQGGATGAGGAISLTTGAGGSSSGTSGILTLSTGTAASGAATGAISIVSGLTAGNASSGAINIVAGQTAGTSAPGTITIGTSTAPTGAAVGGAISILATPGGTTGGTTTGGAVVIKSGGGGTASSVGQTGGVLSIASGAGGAGNSNAGGTGGAISITAGTGGDGGAYAGGNGGAISITSGTAGGLQTTGGVLYLSSGPGNPSGTGSLNNSGAVTLQSGNAGGTGVSAYGNSGSLTIQTGTSVNNNNTPGITSGAITIQTGIVSTSSSTGGAITIRTQSIASTGGTPGAISITAGSAFSSASVDPKPGGAITMTTGNGGGGTSNGLAGQPAGTFSVTGGTGGTAGISYTGGTGGLISLQGGAGGAVGSASSVGGAGGAISIVSGNGGANAITSYEAGSGGTVFIKAGNAGATGTTGVGGTISITAGNGAPGTAGGNISLTSGNGGSSSGNSGNVVIDAGTVVSGTLGSISIGATNANAVAIARSGKTTTIGGDLIITTFASSGTAALCWDNSGASLINDCSGAPVQDYAEIYPTDESVDFGEIVTASSQTTVINRVETDRNGNPLPGVPQTISVLKQSSEPYQNDIVGITSHNWADFSSVGHNSVNENDHPLPVALSGRVPVKVSTENGPINAGDSITSSSTPGIGMKATKPGRIIGIALESFSGIGVGRVLVFVNPVYYLGENVAHEITNPTMTAENFYNPDGSIKDQYKGQVLTSDQIDRMIKQNIPDGALNLAISVDQNQNVGIGISTPSAKLDVGGAIKSGIIGQIAGAVTIAGEETGSVTLKTAQNGSEWTMTLPTDAGANGAVLTTDGAGNTTWIDIASLTTPLRDEIFTTIGSATDSAAQDTIFGKLAKIQDQDIAGINEKLSVFTVATNSVTFVRNAVFDATATFNNGIQVLQDIVLSGRIQHKDQDTAGFAVIKNGFRDVTVTFDRPYMTAPIINVTAQDSSNAAFVKDVTQNGFTVAVAATASADLKFSWNAILIETPRVSESSSSAELSPTVTPTPTP